MKRIILATALLVGGALAAHADTDVWNGKGGDADMHTALGTCTEQFGEEPRGHPAQPRIQAVHAQARLGWRYVTTRHDDTWMKGGMTCHHILNGMGSECSSFWAGDGLRRVQAFRQRAAPLWSAKPRRDAQ